MSRIRTGKMRRSCSFGIFEVGYNVADPIRTGEIKRSCSFRLNNNTSRRRSLLHHHPSQNYGSRRGFSLSQERKETLLSKSEVITTTLHNHWAVVKAIHHTRVHNDRMLRLNLDRDLVIAPPILSWIKLPHIYNTLIILHQLSLVMEPSNWF